MFSITSFTSSSIQHDVYLVNYGSIESNVDDEPGCPFWMWLPLDWQVYVSLDSQSNPNRKSFPARDVPIHFFPVPIQSNYNTWIWISADTDTRADTRTFIFFFLMVLLLLLALCLRLDKGDAETQLQFSCKELWIPIVDRKVPSLFQTPASCSNVVTSGSQKSRWWLL